MKTKHALLALCLSLVASSSAWAKTILPDACGDERIVYNNITITKDHPVPAMPEAGKAQIVFSETWKGGPFNKAKGRFGIDGTWVGATEGNSFFVVTVTPGVHHLCANWQDHKDSDAASVTVEAGKVYYFEVTITNSKTAGPRIIGGGAFGQPPPMVIGGGTNTRGFVFAQLSEDEGKYRVKAWPLSTSNYL